MCAHTRQAARWASKLPFLATTRLFQTVAGRKSACDVSNSTGRVVFSCSNGPATESGERYLGNLGW